MFEHLDADARRIFALAQHEAGDLRHNYVGTEHLLLVLAIRGGATADLLGRHGCGPDQIRAEILSVIGRGPGPQRDPDTLLATLGIDLGDVRRRVESTFGPDAVTTAALPVQRHRRCWRGRRRWPRCDQGRPWYSVLSGERWLGVAPRVKRVIELAVADAAPSSATPLHLLLAILDEGQGVACRILSRRGIDLPALAAATRGELDSTPLAPPPGEGGDAGARSDDGGNAG